VHDADVVYTDVWVSNGQEEETADRVRVMSPFAVTAEALRGRETRGVFHALPAGHAGQEVTQEILDSPRSIIFDQAEKPPAHAEGDSRDGWLLRLKR